MFKELFLSTFLSAVSVVTGNFGTTTNRVYQNIVSADIVESRSGLTDTGIFYTAMSDDFTIYRYMFDSQVYYPSQAAAMQGDGFIMYHYAQLTNNAKRFGTYDVVNCYMVFDYGGIISSTLRLQLNYVSNYDGDYSDYIYFLFDYNPSLTLNYVIDISYLKFDGDNDFATMYYSHINMKDYTSGNFHNFIVAPCTTATNLLNDDGYNASYISVNFSYSEGNSDTIYQNGYDTGYSQGHAVGYTEGQNSTYSFFTLFTSIADTPVYFIRSIFNFDLFGLNVGTMIISLLTGILIFYIIRKFI